MLLLGVLQAQAAGLAAGATGYLGGGRTSVNTNVIEKLDLSTDSIATLAATLTADTWDLNCVAYRGNAIYWAGGGAQSNLYEGLTRYDKLSVVDDSKSTLAATLASGRMATGGYSNESTAGYTLAGFTNNPSSQLRNTIEKLTYSTESNSVLAATLSIPTDSFGSFSNSGTAGYHSGGWNSSSNQSYIDKVTYSTDSLSTLGSGLSVGRRTHEGFSLSGTAGYFMGGFTTSIVTTVDKVSFPTDTVTTLGTGLTVATNQFYTFGSQDYGYVLGGYTPSGLTSAIYKMNFLTDTFALSGTTISVAKSTGAGASNLG